MALPHFTHKAQTRAAKATQAEVEAIKADGKPGLIGPGPSTGNHYHLPPLGTPTVTAGGRRFLLSK